MKQPFVVDNTNPTKKDRQRYIVPAAELSGKLHVNQAADFFDHQLN